MSEESAIPRVFHDGWDDVPPGDTVDAWTPEARTYGTLTSTELCSLLTSHVLGRVLTAVDMMPATLLESAQRKAVKDTIKNLLWDSYLHVHHWMCENAHQDGQVPFPFPWNDAKPIARN